MELLSVYVLNELFYCCRNLWMKLTQSCWKPSASWASPSASRSAWRASRTWRTTMYLTVRASPQPSRRSLQLRASSSAQSRRLCASTLTLLRSILAAWCASSPRLVCNAQGLASVKRSHVACACDTERTTLAIHALGAACPACMVGL